MLHTNKHKKKHKQTKQTNTKTIKKQNTLKTGTKHNHYKTKAKEQQCVIVTVKLIKT